MTNVLCPSCCSYVADPSHVGPRIKCPYCKATIRIKSRSPSGWCETTDSDQAIGGLPSAPTRALSAISGFVFQLIALGAMFVFANGVLWVFGTYAAPLIWTSDTDLRCQADGYWYSKSSPTPGTFRCVSWFVIPIPGRSRSH